MKPFLLKTSSQFRTRGPNDLASAAWARDFNEVKAIGAVDSTVRTETRPTSPLVAELAGRELELRGEATRRP